MEDLERRRPTEVDALNGEVVRLAEAAGLPAPANATVMALVRQAEGRGSPRLDAATLLRHVDEAWRAAGADRYASSVMKWSLLVCALTACGAPGAPPPQAPPPNAVGGFALTLPETRCSRVKS